METVFIYSLKDPVTNEVRYVGKTINPKGRLSSHIKYAKFKKYHSAYWIQSLLNEGYKPVMEILEEANSETWAEREVYWISYYRSLYDLTNISDGGGSDCKTYGFKGKKHTAESIQKMKDKRTGMSINQNDLSGKRVAALRKYNENRKVKIIQYDLDGNFVKIWDSAVDAAKEFDGNHSNIKKVCDGVRKKSNNAQWRYYTDDYPMTIEKYERIFWTKQKD
jgi:hypothetical protein